MAVTYTALFGLLGAVPVISLFLMHHGSATVRGNISLVTDVVTGKEERNVIPDHKCRCRLKFDADFLYYGQPMSSSGRRASDTCHCLATTQALLLPL